MEAVKEQVYKCSLCGITVKILTAGAGDLYCCGKPMILQEENTDEMVKEKHIPVLSAIPSGTKVCIGDISHPMEKDHYIEWIEIINGPYVNRRYLKPYDWPEAEFYVMPQANLIVRAYCNKHGLWVKALS